MKVFAKEFLLGAATSSYQIEGAYNEDGKGLCNWDVFSKIPENIERNENGDVACDHYHHLEEDLDLIASLHLDVYRFSISWARIFPNGTGEINQKGLAFYDRLVDGLLKRGVKPMLTLFHWDLPNELEKKGGWVNKDCIKWYLEYAKVIFEHFNGRVEYWLTFNEPAVYTTFGYNSGIFPPGEKGRIDHQLKAAHYILLAHGLAVRMFREMKIKGKIAITLDYSNAIPFDENDPKDIEASKSSNAFAHGWYYEPVVLGHYPQISYNYYKKQGLLDFIEDGDLEIISEPIDFLGLNAYYCSYVKYDENEMTHAKFVSKPLPKSDMGWDINPEGFYKLVSYIKETSPYPLFITENGISLDDYVNEEGRVQDPRRTDYVEKYLVALQKAMDEGLNCMGYCYWSLLDNFEWACGYRGRFGMIYVDFNTLKRTIKDFGYTYRDWIDLKNSQNHKDKDKVS